MLKLLLESWERLHWPGWCRALRRHRARPRPAVVADAGPRTATSSKPTAPTTPRTPSRPPAASVISRLGVIDAVEAKLTDSQHASVLATQGIKQITPNAIVTTQAAANVRDNFETGSFANNDGTHRWYGDWVEQNDNNSPYNGKVSIGWNDRGGNRLILSGNGAIYRRAATPSSSPTVTLKFKYSRASLEAGEYVSVQASGNGGATWTEVGRISGAGNDTGFTAESYNITAYRGRNTAIRFVGSMSEAFPDDYVDIDDVEIAYTTTFGEGDPAPVDVNAKRPAHRRHPRPRHRRRHHRHRLLETRFARQGHAAATAASPRSTTP